MPHEYLKVFDDQKAFMARKLETYNKENIEIQLITTQLPWQSRSNNDCNLNAIVNEENVVLHKPLLNIWTMAVSWGNPRFLLTCQSLIRVLRICVKNSLKPGENPIKRRFVQWLALFFECSFSRKTLHRSVWLVFSLWIDLFDRN